MFYYQIASISLKTDGHWQVHTDFIKAIEDLTKTNNLIEGPDLFTAAKNDVNYLGTYGVHLGNAGCAALHKLWADKMDALYSVVYIEHTVKSIITDKTPYYTIIAKNNKITVITKRPGTIVLFSINGSLLESIQAPIAGKYNTSGIRGCVIMRFITLIDEETELIISH